MIANASRASGILVHITSLPSLFGIGDLGPQSHQFVELLAKLKQRYWSILPVNPTRLEYGNSPYKNASTFAGNTLLISPEQLTEDGLLPKEYTQRMQVQPSSNVDYPAVKVAKKAMLNEAYSNFKRAGKPTLGTRSFELFCLEEEEWLEDFALYESLRAQSGEPWFLWPKPLRDRDPLGIVNKIELLKDQIEKQKFEQYIFFNQWFTFRDYAAKTGVKIIGDMPFYVGYDSADMWSNPQLFKLDKNKKPQYVGGVPPDYFSSTGQLWGDPVYNWRTLQKTCFNWWINRINNKLRLYDVLRLDHFRGFIAYWQVPAGEKTARNGQWIRAPTKSFFDAVQGAFPSMPFIAEDLGSITKNVYDVISQLQLPGMRVLIFAFNGSQSNPHLPDNYTQNTVVYTGTHDTNTVKGWFVEETTTKIKQQISSYIGRQVSKDNISIELIKLALSSRANLSIIPLQDVLGLGAEARMNHPAKQTGNWVWRVTSQQLTSKKLEKIGELTTEFNRS